MELHCLILNHRVVLKGVGLVISYIAFPPMKKEWKEFVKGVGLV